MDFTSLTSCQVSASLHFGPCYQRQLPFLTNPFVFQVPFCSLAAGQSDSGKDLQRVFGFRVTGHRMHWKWLSVILKDNQLFTLSAVFWPCMITKAAGFFACHILSVHLSKIQATHAWLTFVHVTPPVIAL